MPALTSMQQSTMALARKSARFSHDLHPSLLQHAGLGAALRVFCAEFEKLHAMAVTCTAAADSATHRGRYRAVPVPHRSGGPS